MTQNKVWMMKSYQKFEHPEITAKGEQRATVTLRELKTLWFNTGTLCNLECENCYIESSPKNDRLSYLSFDDVKQFVDEIKTKRIPTETLGFTGGEPFLNPQIEEILSYSLKHDFNLIVLTNAYRVLDRHKTWLKDLNQHYKHRLQLRVSLDHYSPAVHEAERGKETFFKTIESIKWLADEKFNFSIAGRSLVAESDEQTRHGYQQLFTQSLIDFNAMTPSKLIIFPEMIEDENVPEITISCWDILNKKPEQQMCASERMIVKRKGADQPVVLPCTLLAYDPQFELGTTLDNAQKTVHLNHPYCAKFCVLGGASCSATS